MNIFDAIGGVQIEEEQGTSEVYVSRSRQVLTDLHIREDIPKRQTHACIEKTLDDIALPLPGHQMRIRFQKQLSMIAFIVKILYDRLVQIDELIICTYTLNRESFDILLDLYDAGEIKSMQLALASSYTFRDRKHYEYMKAECLSRQFNLFFSWLHCKITLAKCGEDYYQIEGSMNYSTNNMVEQIVLENNKELYEHDRQFILSLKDSNQAAVEIVR